MNQEKIGKFIMMQRKEKGYTQQQLGELIGVSNKSISKWERGINLPDSSLYIPLCNALDISLDEFFSGEKQQDSQPFLSTEKLEANYQKSKKVQWIHYIICIISFINLQFIIFQWHWNLEWLKMYEHLSFYANLWYLSFGYILAYYLAFKKKKMAYTLMWSIYFILCTGIISNWGYDFGIFLSCFDFWTNLALTILGYCNETLKFSFQKNK